MRRTLLAMLLCTALLLETLGVAAGASAGVPGDSGFLWLVNYNHSVAADYVPANMRAVGGTSQKMQVPAADALEKMVAALRADGHSIQLSSGYRDYARQNYLFTSRIQQKQQSGMSYDAAYAATKRFTAIPGTSEHQLGLAMDFSVNGSLTQSFGSTAQGKWLAANAYRYGFILRYSESKAALTQIGNEPWHFRYVGVPHAQIMKEKGWCFEEYIQYLRDQKYVTLQTGDQIYEIYWTEGATGGYSGVIDISSDNQGGTIVTTCHPADPMAYIKGHWSESSFRELLGDKIPDNFGTINPEVAITRGEFAALYAQLLPGASQNPGFSDVPESYPFYQGVATVAAAGVMSGNGGRFRPEGTLTREEAAVAVAASVEGSNLQYLGYLDVGNISGWAFQSVQKLAYCQLMNGDNGKFRPKDTMTWGEAAALLCKLKEYK